MLYFGWEAALAQGSRVLDIREPEGCCIWDGRLPWGWMLHLRWAQALWLSVLWPLQTYMLHDSLEHAQLFDLMRRMLEFDPSQRITFSEALLHPFFAGLSAEERMLCGRGASRDLSR